MIQFKVRSFYEDNEHVIFIIKRSEKSVTFKDAFGKIYRKPIKKIRDTNDYVECISCSLEHSKIGCFAGHPLSYQEAKKLIQEEINLWRDYENEKYEQEAEYAETYGVVDDIFDDEFNDNNESETTEVKALPATASQSEEKKESQPDDTSKIVRFVVGETYGYMFNSYATNYTYNTYKVIKRTPKTITIEDSRGKTQLCRIKISSNQFAENPVTEESVRQSVLGSLYASEPFEIYKRQTEENSLPDDTTQETHTEVEAVSATASQPADVHDEKSESHLERKKDSRENIQREYIGTFFFFYFVKSFKKKLPLRIYKQQTRDFGKRDTDTAYFGESFLQFFDENDKAMFCYFPYADIFQFHAAFFDFFDCNRYDHSKKIDCERMVRSRIGSILNNAGYLDQNYEFIYDEHGAFRILAYKYAMEQKDMSKISSFVMPDKPFTSENDKDNPLSWPTNSNERKQAMRLFFRMQDITNHEMPVCNEKDKKAYLKEIDSLREEIRKLFDTQSKSQPAQENKPASQTKKHTRKSKQEIIPFQLGMFYIANIDGRNFNARVTAFIEHFRKFSKADKNGKIKNKIVRTKKVCFDVLYNGEIKHMEAGIRIDKDSDCEYITTVIYPPVKMSANNPVEGATPHSVSDITPEYKFKPDERYPLTLRNYYGNIKCVSSCDSSVTFEFGAYNSDSYCEQDLLTVPVFVEPDTKSQFVHIGKWTCYAHDSNQDNKPQETSQNVQQEAKSKNTPKRTRTPRKRVQFTAQDILSCQNENDALSLLMTLKKENMKNISRDLKISIHSSRRFKINWFMSKEQIARYIAHQLFLRRKIQAKKTSNHDEAPKTNKLENFSYSTNKKTGQISFIFE